MFTSPAFDCHIDCRIAVGDHDLAERSGEILQRG